MMPQMTALTTAQMMEQELMRLKKKDVVGLQPRMREMVEITQKNTRELLLYLVVHPKMA